VYNDEEIDYNTIDMTQFEKKFVKLIVANKTDLYQFDRFVDKLQDVDSHELKIAESFEEYKGDNVEDEAVSLEDTKDLLDTYVDAVDTDLDKDGIKVRLRELYTEAQNLEVV
jgi:sulfatase maturation enzyme AslB (radical SAM superfamily)